MCTPHLIQLDNSLLTLKDSWHMDEDAYEGLKSYIYKENLSALRSIQLREPICTALCNNMCRHQYVDIGCGPGNFTKEKLLSISHPDSSRIVALDRSRHAVDYAKANFSHSRIAYDVFDVEYDDFTPILQRYGPSDRIYSFYTFHYIVDLEKAYRNVAGLLKPGGDCAIAALTGGDAIDVWDAVYRMAEWRQMINPRDLFPGMYRCGGKSGYSAQRDAETRSSLAAAGLRCVAYRQYETRWKFNRIEDFLDNFMESFNAYDGVPHEDRTAFRDLWIQLMLQRTRTATGGQIEVTYTLEIVHAQKPGVN
ncbi:juvenile hormone acid O-methyltransferase-like [Haemaphysalis longicornis]